MGANMKPQRYNTDNKESVFIGTLFYFAQNKHTLFVHISQT